MLDVSDDELTEVVELNRSTAVTVGSVVPPTLVSSVRSGLPVNDPCSVPCVETFGLVGPARFGGLFNVTRKVIVMVLPAGSVNPEPVP